MESARDGANFLKMLECPGSVGDYYLFRVDGREMLSTPFEFRLTLRSQGDPPDASAWLGSSITFAMGLSDGVDRKVNGQCVRFELAYQKDAYVEFVLELSAALADAKLTHDCRIFTQQTVKQVIAQMLDKHSISYDDSKVKNVTEVKEYCAQYNESDFAFMSRLMEREGIFYYFRYDDGGGQFKHKMYLSDDASGYFDGDPYSVSFHRDHVLKGLQELGKSFFSLSGSRTTNDYDYKRPHDLSPVRTGTRLDWPDSAADIYAWPADSKTMEGVRRSSTLGMEEAEASAVLLEGSGSYLAFVPGARFEVDDQRLTTPEKRIVIRSVAHSAFDPYGLEEGDPSYVQQFTAVPSALPYRPPRTTSPAMVRGPQTGIVIDQNDPEGFGRIKVQFHWDRQGASTCWLRVAQQWAGAQMGAQFIPRVNMEVLIDFLEGDPDRPLVVGCLYNGENKPPFDLPSNLSQSGWKSTSLQGGAVDNQFMFEDKDGSEEIYTFAGRNYRRKVVNDEDVDIGGMSTLKVGKDSKSEIGGSANVKVGSDALMVVMGDANIKVSGALEIESDTAGKMKSSGGLTLESTTSLTLQVGASKIEVLAGVINITAPIVKIN